MAQLKFIHYIPAEIGQLFSYSADCDSVCIGFFIPGQGLTVPQSPIGPGFHPLYQIDPCLEFRPLRAGTPSTELFGDVAVAGASLVLLTGSLLPPDVSILVNPYAGYIYYLSYPIQGRQWRVKFSSGQPSLDFLAPEGYTSPRNSYPLETYDPFRLMPGWAPYNV